MPLYLRHVCRMIFFLNDTHECQETTERARQGKGEKRGEKERGEEERGEERREGEERGKKGRGEEDEQVPSSSLCLRTSMAVTRCLAETREGSKDLL